MSTPNYTNKQDLLVSDLNEEYNRVTVQILEHYKEILHVLKMPNEKTAKFGGDRLE